MKKVLLFLLLAVGLMSAKAAPYTISNQSNTTITTATSTAYSGLVMTNCTNVHLIMGAGSTITGEVDISGGANDTLDGFVFHSAHVPEWKGNGLYFVNCAFSGVGGGNAIFDWVDNASGIVTTNLSITHSTFAGTQQIFQGTFNTGVGIVDSFTFAFDSVTNLQNTGTGFRSGGVSHISFHDLYLNGSITSPFSGDNGFFSFNGNGSIYNVFATGEYGWLGRLIGYSKTGETDPNFHLYNIYYTGNFYYGCWDLRSPTTNGANFYVDSTTIYNINANSYYVGPVALIYGMGVFTKDSNGNLRYSGYTVHVHNVVAIQTRNGSGTNASAFVINYLGPANVDNSNNFYYALPTGIIDTTTGGPAANSPLVANNAGYRPTSGPAAITLNSINVIANYSDSTTLSIPGTIKSAVYDAVNKTLTITLLNGTVVIYNNK